MSSGWELEADDGVAVAVGSDVDDLKTNLLLPIVTGAIGLLLGIGAGATFLWRRFRSAREEPAEAHAT